MSNYTKSTNFATKDNLTPGDPLKVVRGTEIDTEFNNIATAIATKTDNASAAITGGSIDGATVGATTPATGSFTTLAASGTTTLAGALVGAVTQAAFNTVSTTLNLGGAATAVNLGAATGTATVNNTTLAAKAITASTTLAVTGTSTLTGAVTATAGVSGPITSSSVSITGGSITGITDLAVADGGTGASTAAGGLNNLLPSQTGNASKYLQTDGTNATWDAVSLSTADITGTLGAANGGTGVSNNAAMTVTGSGNFAYTRTLTGTTNVTFPTTGTLATLAGTETLTNKTLTSPTLTTPTLGVATGTSFQGIIGNVTPAAGSFTTLGASSTATLNTLASSGATLTGGTINGMTVGATTASSGAFTTVTASTAIGTASGGTGLTSFTSGGVVYASSSSALATGSALTYDGAGVLTVGSDAVATVFNAPGDVLQFKVDSNGNSGGSPNIQWLQASSELMRLTSTGLGIGTSSPATKLSFGSYIPSDGQTIHVFHSSNTRSGLGVVSGAYRIFTDSGSAMSFGQVSTSDGSTYTERARIDSSGQFMIGTQTPLDIATVVMSGSTNGNGLTVRAANSSGAGSQPGIVFASSAGAIAGQVFADVGGSSLYLNNGSGGSTVFLRNSTESARIDSSGRFGVGTSSPASYGGSAFTKSVNIGSLNTITAGFSDEVTGTFRIAHASGQNILNFDTSALCFQSGGSTPTERARIDSSGNLLVGTTSSSGRLTVEKNTGGISSIYAAQDTAGGYCYVTNAVTNGGTFYHMRFLEAGTQIGSITSNGTITVYNTTSDYRLKTVVGAVTGQGARLDALEPVEYTWNANGSRTRGFLAHKFQEVYADSVTGTKDAVDANGNPVYQSMQASTSEVIADLVAEIQSLRQRLSAANL